MADEQYYMGNPSLPKRGATFEYTKQQIKDLKKAAENIIFFAETFFYIIAPSKGRELINLHTCQKRILRTFRDNRFNITLASRQVGKALDIDTPIPTPNGWKKMGDLMDGDEVFDINGSPCIVLKAHDIMLDRECYEVVFDNGEKIVADSEHNWFTQTKSERAKKSIGSVKTTKEIFNTLSVKFSTEPNHRIPSAIRGVEYSEKELPIDPYVLGIWLGDGCCASSAITVGRRDINHIIQKLENNKQFNKLIIKEYKEGVFTLRPTTDHRQTNSLQVILRQCNLLGNKHIPEEYMMSSREQRLELLRGLIDSDGYISKIGVCQFYNTNLSLVKSVQLLVESLGYKVTYNERVGKFNGVDHKLCASITFKPIELICTIPFKADRIHIQSTEVNSQKRAQWHYIKAVRPVKSVPVRCITVDSPDSLFLCGKKYIPTHNTTLMTIFALWVACFKRDQRILIVANKESTAIEIFRRVRMAYEELPNWLKPPVVEYGKTSCEFENGSRISITTTTSSAGRGSSCDLLILDEFAHVDYHLVKEFWAAVYPIISASKSSKILIASTPNGTDNLFYKLWAGAEKGENGWTPSKIHWSEIPGRDEKWAKATKESLESEDLWLQEFELQFHASGQSAIDYAQYETFKLRLRDPDLLLDDGHYKVYSMPDPDRIYVAGIDIAEGVGQDASIIEILDITDLQSIEQVAEYWSDEISPYNFATKVKDILANWGNPLALIERNNQGAQIIDKLVNEENYPNIVSYGASAAKRKREQLGMISHTNTKHAAITNTRYWMNELDCIRIYSRECLNEFKHFIKKPNGGWGAESGFHDDRVMAICWALMILHKDIVSRYFEINEEDVNGKPKRITMMDFGLKYFSTSQSLFSTEENKESVALPVLFNNSPEFDNADIEDLFHAGWQKLY